MSKKPNIESPYVSCEGCNHLIMRVVAKERMSIEWEFTGIYSGPQLRTETVYYGGCCAPPGHLIIHTNSGPRFFGLSDLGITEVHKEA